MKYIVKVDSTCEIQQVQLSKSVGYLLYPYVAMSSFY